jgi:hypothetical protein
MLYTLSHNVVSSTPHLNGLELTTLVVIGTDGIDSYKPNYHTIMTMTVSVRTLGNTVHDNIDQKDTTLCDKVFQ